MTDLIGMADFQTNIENPDKGLQLTEEEAVKTLEAILHDVQDDYKTTDTGGIVENVASLVHGAKARVIENYSDITLVSSMKQNGMGKSTLLYKMAKRIDPKRFTFERNFFFGGGLAEIRAKTNELPIGSILCLDETVGLWYKRRAMTKKNIDLNEWMAQSQRKTRVILAGAIPDFFDVDPYARQGKVDRWVEVLSRGVGMIFEADRFPKTDPWHEDLLEKIQRDRRKHVNEGVGEKVRLLRRHPCYCGMVFWTAMPKEDAAIYAQCVRNHEAVIDDTVREDEMEKFKREWLEKEGAEKIRIARAVVNVVNMLKLRNVPQAHILKEAGIDLATLNRYTREIKEQDARSPFKPAVLTTVAPSISEEVASDGEVPGPPPILRSIRIPKLMEGELESAELPNQEKK